MKTDTSSAIPGPADRVLCLTRTVAEAMKAEPALEAVKNKPAQRSIFVGPPGPPKNPELQSYLTAQVRQIEQGQTGQRCALLDGADDCSTCPAPQPPAERGRLSIRQEGDTTTIARVTCVTAPKFWRWREIPWPRLVPREVVLPEDAEHEHEWKLQLLAATLCGLFGLTAGFLAQGLVARVFYVLAYVAGSWFTVHEIQELLQKRALDVHFLMLVVALGSASIGAWGEGAMLLFLFSFSGALEHYAMGRTHREIRSLFKTAPKVATLVDGNGNERAVAVEQLEPGMRLLIKPGEQFPADAEINKGRTAADESNLTGESTPAGKSSFYRAMTLLVVASPCALVLSIPSAVLAAIAWAAKRGILFRGGAAVEKLAEISVVAMDKTGTLTTGDLKVERVESFPPGREQEVSQLAYSLERLSTHPLARAITRFGKQQQLAALALEQVESITGAGLRAQHKAGRILLGRR